MEISEININLVKPQNGLIAFDNLIGQVNDLLGQIKIPKEFLHWALKILRDKQKVEENTRGKILAQQRHNFYGVLQRIDNLLQL